MLRYYLGNTGINACLTEFNLTCYWHLSCKSISMGVKRKQLRIWNIRREEPGQSRDLSHTWWEKRGTLKRIQNPNGESKIHLWNNKSRQMRCQEQDLSCKVITPARTQWKELRENRKIPMTEDPGKMQRERDRGKRRGNFHLQGDVVRLLKASGKMLVQVGTYKEH